MFKPIASSYHRSVPTRCTPLILLTLLLGLGGCGAPYDPPVQGDHRSEKYKTDLENCRTSSTETVRRQNAAYPGTWIMSPINGPPEVRAAIRTCMVGKGYTLENTGG